jgi:eukaryotic-like serine/threonine-protein kinase
VSGNEWQSRVEALFHEALAVSKESRKSWLEQNCPNDPRLLREVGSLLAHADPAMLDKPLWDVARGLLGDAPVLQPGSELGPYKVFSRMNFGNGLYRAKYSCLDLPVTIQLLSPPPSEGFADTNGYLEKFRQICRLSHPHIGRVYHTGRDLGVDYIVMEELEGEILADRLQRGSLEIEEAIDCALRLAGAINNAHSNGVTHGHVSAENVVLTRTGPKLIGFGGPLPQSSESFDSDVEKESPGIGYAKTRLAAAPLTPAHNDRRSAELQSDIFAFGLLLADLIGSRPSKASNTLEQSPRRGLLGLLDHVIERCLTKDEDRRFKSAQEIVSELQQIADEEKPVRISFSTQSSSNSRIWIILVCILFLALAALYSVVLIRG